MKKVLLMIAAALLLMTQCRKDEMPAVMPETNTVRMTVTVGSGSKTDISETGGIAWSSGDRLYVGNGSKCIGCLDIEQSDTGQATANFSGKVDLTGVADGQEFGFFYLGNGATFIDNEGKEITYPDFTNKQFVVVDFSNQNITANEGKLQNAAQFHVGYGTGTGVLKEVTTTEGTKEHKVEISEIVSMKSKVALVRFNFTKDNDNPVTVSGIYDKMTVNFNGSFVGSYKDGKTGTFTLNDNKAYVMLVPTANTTELKLIYNNKTRLVTFNNGIKENKFYDVSVDFTK